MINLNSGDSHFSENANRSKQLFLTFGLDNRICVWQLSMNGDNMLTSLPTCINIISNLPALITAILDLEDGNHIAIGTQSGELQIINYLNNKKYP